MARPTGNLLELLELLQSRPQWSGAELAERLEVDRRTVRRYVAALQELGIPVAAERGPAGGYRLRPGYRLPPLMLSDDEAAATVLGLVAARRLGLGEAAATDEALAKLRRVLPDRLRLGAEALEAALHLTLPATRSGPGAPAGRRSPAAAGRSATAAVLLALAEAAHRRRRVLADYERADGTASARELSPYGLVAHSGRWYVSAHDHDRGELRTFRADRMGAPVLGGAAEPAPEGHDPAAHVQRSLARVPWQHVVRVRLDLPVAAARERLPPALAELEPDGDGTLLSMRVDSLDWMATILAGLGADFVVLGPDGLEAAVRRLADRLIRQVDLPPT